jgi:hypothetical protein
MPSVRPDPANDPDARTKRPPQRQTASNRHQSLASGNLKGSEHRDVGATLVVALSATRFAAGGDHKGRPYNMAFGGKDVDERDKPATTAEKWFDMTGTRSGVDRCMK